MSLKRLLESADIFTDALLLVRLDGTIEAVNGACAAHLGQDPQALAGQRLESLSALSAPSALDLLRECAGSGTPVYGSLILRRDGRALPFQASGVAYPPESAPNGTQVLLRLQPIADASSGAAPESALADQTEHWQQITDSLRRQSQILEVTLASIGDAVIVTDERGCITFLNSVAESLTGWTLEQARAQPLKAVFRIVNERTRRPVEDPVAKVLSSGAVIGLANHTVLLARSGHEVAIDDSAAPIRLPDGTLFGVVLIFRDITQQRQAEYSRAWLAAIVESSDDPIVSKTLQGVVTSWNAAAARLFEYSAEEIVGQSITRIIPEELRSEEDTILSRLHQGERIEHFETVRQAKNGRRIDVSLTVSPIRNEEGEVVGASKIARDISKRKEWERLQREADRLKDEFLATLGHELRNPLAPIQNVTELICRTVRGQPQLPAELRTACTILQRQLSHLTRLVDDLLDVSRVTSGRLQLRHEVIELAPLLAATVDTLRPAIEAKSQTIVLSLAPAAGFVRGDAVRLTQVFSNLLQNANKYTPAGGRIELTLRYQADIAIISVSDNGMGISAENLQAIFDLFFQTHRAYDRTGGGLGIGLSLARRLVQMHGGSIDVRSEGEGRGSEFTVRLPLAEPAAPKAVAPTGAGSGGQARRRILIADDNEDAALSLAMLLQSLGHETRTAFDGLAALDIAEHFHPDVMFLDLAMPKLDGYEAARRARTRPWASGTLLVALTGWGQQADRERTSAAGFARHIVKPVDLEALRELLSTR